MESQHDMLKERTERLAVMKLHSLVDRRPLCCKTAGRDAAKLLDRRILQLETMI